MAPTTSVSPGLQRFVDLAVDDLAARLAMKADQIEVIEAKAVVWPDGSLGCPQPGMGYTQLPEEGALIRQRVGERESQYHSGAGRAMFLCERSTKPLALTTVPGSANEQQKKRRAGSLRPAVLCAASSSRLPQARDQDGWGRIAASRSPRH